MKRLFLLLFALACVNTAYAQYAPTFYADSLTATGVTTAGVHTRGYDTFRALRSDLVNFEVKKIAIKFAKTTDSVKVQGAKVNFGTDTTWEDITVNKRLITAINTGAGSSMSRDTSVVWITPVTTGIANYTSHNPGSTGLLDLPAGYRAYRVVSGKNDTGKVYIQTTLVPKR